MAIRCVTVKIITVLSSLTLPVIAHTDYFYVPTRRPQENNPYSSDTTNRNRYFESRDDGIIHVNLEIRSADRDGKGQHTDNGEIIYPEQATCIHGLCTNVAGYPKEQIKKLLSRSEFAQGFFETTEEFAPSLDNRFNTDEMSLCETKVHTVYPEKANNTMKVEKVIINVEGHKQGVVFETCVNNQGCKFSQNFPTGYISQCKQKYINKKLMVLGEGDNFVYDLFEVPSCCVCTVIKTR